MNNFEKKWITSHRTGVIEKSNTTNTEKLEFINNSSTTVYRKNQFKKSKREINWIYDLNSLNTERSEYIRFLSNFFFKQNICITSKNNEEINCINSRGSQLFTFLMFKDDDEYFYLVQNHQVLAGVYFPTTNEYFQFSGGNINGYLKLIKRHFVNSKHYFNKSKEFIPIFSCTRPWHFFYNQATALAYIVDNLKIKEETLYYLRGGDFIHPKKISKDLKYKETNIKEINTLEKSPFLFGFDFNSITDEEHKLLRKKIIDNITLSSNIEKNSNLRIWIGITSQKRRWVEQVEGISLLIKLLQKNKIAFKIIFDGWTSPITSSESDQKNITSDLKVIDEIVNNCDFKFNYDSVVGHTAEQKIKEALNCDFYVSNYASGSLFVSRFAGITGLSHLNNNMDRNHHIHHRNTEIPNSIINDINEDGKVGHHVSYSIKPTDFINYFKIFYNEIKISELNSMRID